MRIQMLGSMSFIKDMTKVKEDLEKLGHLVNLPHDANKFLSEPEYSTDNHEEDMKFCLENNIMKECFNFIKESDAVLVVDKVICRKN